MTIVIELIKIGFALLTVIFGASLAVFVYHRLSPLIALNVTASWPTKNSLILRFEIENKSKVRLTIERGSVIVSFNEHEYKPDLLLSEFVNLDNAITILETSEYVFPGEKIIVDRLFPVTKDIVQVGLQVKVVFNKLDRIVSNIPNEVKSWTTTRIFCNPKLSNS